MAHSFDEKVYNTAGIETSVKFGIVSRLGKDRESNRLHTWEVGPLKKA